METVEVVILVAGFVFSAITFVIGLVVAGNKAGREMGKITADIAYIKELLTSLDMRWKDEFKRLEGRVDEHTHQISMLCANTTKALESTASAHKRIDERNHA